MIILLNPKFRAQLKSFQCSRKTLIFKKSLSFGEKTLFDNFFIHFSFLISASQLRFVLSNSCSLSTQQWLSSKKNCIFGNVNLSKTKWSTTVYYENWVCRCLPTPYKVKRNTHLCLFRYFRKMFFWNLNFEFCTFFLQKRPNWSSPYILLLTMRRIRVKCETATFRLFFEQFPKKTFGNVFRKTVSFSFRSGFSESIIFWIIIIVNDHFTESKVSSSNKII